MSSKIIDVLTTLGLLDKYKTKFEEEDVDDWVVEEWLQDSSCNELKLVIATAGDRLRFVRAFQQLSSSEPGTISSPKPSSSSQIETSASQSSNKSIQIQESKKSLAETDNALENASLSKKKKNSNNVPSSNQKPAPPSQELSFDLLKEIPSLPKPIPNATKSKTNSALDLMENEFKPRLKLLQSNRYFVYQNAQAEIEEIKTKIRSILPTFLKLQNQTFKVETEFKKRSAFLNRLNNENKNRLAEVNHQIETRFESLCQSEYQRLKQAAQENIPASFSWTFDLDKLHGHYDYFLKGLVTPNSSAHDLQFQQNCRETCKSNIEDLCRLTTFSSSLVNEYSRQMRIELGKAGCIDTESEFSQLHEKIFSHTFKSCSTNLITEFPKNLSKYLDDLTRSLILDYERKFREENNQIRTKTDPTAMIEIAVERYISIMNEKTTQPSGVFNRFKISEFHKIAYDNIKEYFDSHPANKNTFNLKSVWVKVEGRLKELEKDYQEKNARKIDKNALLHKISFSAAENEYRKLMYGFVSINGQGKSLSRDKLEKFHEEAGDTALKLYRVKMQGVMGDAKTFEESLIQRFQDEQKILILENEEKLARELKDFAEAKAKEEVLKKLEIEKDKARKREQEEQQRQLAIEKARKRERDEQQRKQKEQETNFKYRVKTLEHFKSNQNLSVFQGGVAIHLNRSGLHVVSFQQQTGFTTICQNFPPCIAFAQHDVLIGTEAHTLCNDRFSENFQKYDLFNLLQSDTNAAQRLTVHNNLMFLRTEEIVAVFLHKLSHIISNVYPDFHPTTCHVEFVISPFLRLPAKHLIKNALVLAGFSRAHILQSTSAMALTYFYYHPDKLDQDEAPHFILAVHSSSLTFDIVVSSGSGHTVTSRRQTGLPNMEIPGVLQGFYNSAEEYFGGSTGHEKAIKGFLKSVLNECKLNPKDIQGIVSVVSSPNQRAVLQNVVGDLFHRHAQIVDECQGILQGAAAFAAWKAGLPTFSQRLHLEEIRPYSLHARFSRSSGSHVDYELISRQESCDVDTNIKPYLVLQEDSRFSNRVCFLEASKTICWEVAEFTPGPESKLSIVGKKLQFEMSPEGLINVQWPIDSQWTHLMPIKSKHLWLNEQEMEGTKKKQDKIFSMMTGSTMTTTLKPSIKVPPFSRTFASVSTAVTEATRGRHNSCRYNTKPRESADESESKERKELESLSVAVKFRLDNSPSTSSLVRGPIEELLREIQGILGKSSGVDAALIKSYKQKLEIRAKRIK